MEHPPVGEIVSDQNDAPVFWGGVNWWSAAHGEWRTVRVTSWRECMAETVSLDPNRVIAEKAYEAYRDKIAPIAPQCFVSLEYDELEIIKQDAWLAVVKVVTQAMGVELGVTFLLTRQ